MPLIKGDRLGPYEILALVGQGGMGEVYRAHDGSARTILLPLRRYTRSICTTLVHFVILQVWEHGKRQWPQQGQFDRA